MKKILIVISRYNNTEPLMNSTIKVIKKKRIKWSIIKVNGAFEIPVVIARNLKKFDAFVALGIILKGETPNFDFISQAITNGLMNLSISSKKPIGNGILTCLSRKQAEKRKLKGAEAIKAVLDVLSH
tara:strand:- start:2343 stop:2723 length:381 start_codon:yes stop_codon:yes gene_type:complete